jgi:phosphinothricin acetyltransferase
VIKDIQDVKMADIIIRPMDKKDWDAVKTIYKEGIATHNATFETRLPAWDEWDQNHIRTSRLVALNKDKVVGWAALLPISDRAVYRGVAEVSIYVFAAHQGIGIGKRLLQRLINESEEHGIWTLQAGIFPENTISIRLHESCGFRRVGFRQKIGNLEGVWRDVILLEHRSDKI